MNKKELIEKYRNKQEKWEIRMLLDYVIEDLSSLPDEWVDAIVKKIMYRIHEIWIMEGTATYHYIKAILENNLSPKESNMLKPWEYMKDNNWDITTYEDEQKESKEEKVSRMIELEEEVFWKESKEEKNIERLWTLSPISREKQIKDKINELIDARNNHL